jgi:hypothetical protein
MDFGTFLLMRSQAAEALGFLNVCSFRFGDLEHPRVLRSMELFAREVMPAFR